VTPGPGGAPARWIWAWRGVGLGRLLGLPVRLDSSWFAGLAVLVALSRELWAPAATGLAAVALSGAFAVAFFAAVLVVGGAGAALWQRTPRWLPQVVLGLFLWQAAAEGARSAARANLLAGRAGRG
jgi:hypothetical protein